jgi:hypothetical protein
MADFGGLASVMQMHNMDLSSQGKQTKNLKKTLDVHQASNSKVSLKLLQILKENQDELLIEEQQEMQKQQQQQSNKTQQQQQLEMQPANNNLNNNNRARATIYEEYEEVVY